MPCNALSQSRHQAVCNFVPKVHHQQQNFTLAPPASSARPCPLPGASSSLCKCATVTKQTVAPSSSSKSCQRQDQVNELAKEQHQQQSLAGKNCLSNQKLSMLSGSNQCSIRSSSSGISILSSKSLNDDLLMSASSKRPSSCQHCKQHAQATTATKSCQPSNWPAHHHHPASSQPIASKLQQQQQPASTCCVCCRCSCSIKSSKSLGSGSAGGYCSSSSSAKHFADMAHVSKTREQQQQEATSDTDSSIKIVIFNAGSSPSAAAGGGSSKFCYNTDQHGNGFLHDHETEPAAAASLKATDGHHYWPSQWKTVQPISDNGKLPCRKQQSASCSSVKSLSCACGSLTAQHHQNQHHKQAAQVSTASIKQQQQQANCFAHLNDLKAGAPQAELSSTTCTLHNSRQQRPACSSPSQANSSSSGGSGHSKLTRYLCLKSVTCATSNGQAQCNRQPKQSNWPPATETDHCHQHRRQQSLNGGGHLSTIDSKFNCNLQSHEEDERALGEDDNETINDANSSSTGQVEGRRNKIELDVQEEQEVEQEDRRLSESRQARQKLAALFSQKQELSTNTNTTTTNHHHQFNRPLSRCSAASSVSISTTTATSSSASSAVSSATTTNSSQASLSSHAALSAYTTSSISLVTPTQCNQANHNHHHHNHRHREVNGFVGEQELPLNEGRGKESAPDENNNGGEYPDAYAADLDKSNESARAPAPPTPPPPPPPPPPVGLSDHFLEASNGADPLRQALVKRLLRSSNTDESGGGGGGGGTSTNVSTKTSKASAAAASAAGRGRVPVPHMVAFIPPQFSAPPKDGTNIKPSEYLKRVNSSSALAGSGAGSGAGSAPVPSSTDLQPQEQQLKISRGCGGSGSTTSTSSSGVSSKSQSNSSTPSGSLSSSTGASLISRSSLASSSNAGHDNSSSTSGEEDTVARTRSTRSRNFQSSSGSQAPTEQGTSNRFKQLKQRRPFAGLNRSQSTSALNKLEDILVQDGESADEDKDEDEDGDDDADFDDEDDGQSDQDDGSNLSNYDESPATGCSSEASSDSKLSTSKTTTTRDNIASNLMGELRNFDKTRLLRMIANNDAGEHKGPAGKASSVVSQPTSKLDHMLAVTKRDLIAELKEWKDLDGIKRMRESHRGKQEIKQVIAAVMPVFKAEDFLDKVAENEPELPLWRRQMLAKKAADRARKEHEDKLRLALEERRLSQVPQWKRQMMAKKAAERSKRNAEVEKLKKDNEQRHLSEMPTWRRQLARIKITASTGSINTTGQQQHDN